MAYHQLHYSADTNGWGQYTLDKDYRNIFVIISAAEPNMGHHITLDFSTTCSNIIYSKDYSCEDKDDGRGIRLKFIVISDAKQGDVIKMKGNFYTIRLVLGID